MGVTFAFLMGEDFGRAFMERRRMRDDGKPVRLNKVSRLRHMKTLMISITTVQLRNKKKV